MPDLAPRCTGPCLLLAIEKLETFINNFWKILVTTLAEKKKTLSERQALLNLIFLPKVNIRGMIYGKINDKLLF